MQCSCSMQCWVSACSAVPSGKRAAARHKPCVLLVRKKNSSPTGWIQTLNSPSTVDIHFQIYLHLLIHLQNKQNSSQKHAVASRNKTCSLVWDMLVVHVENSCKNDIQIPKTFCSNSSTSKRHKHSFATQIPKTSFLSKTSINNSSCTKTSCRPKIHQFQMFSYHSASFPEFCSTKTLIPSCWVRCLNYMQERSTPP